MIIGSYFQTNRYFSIRGKVESMAVELKYTKIVISVFDYSKRKDDKFTIYFKGEAKREADSLISPDREVLVMGDMVMSNSSIFLNGKIVEVFKTVIVDQISKAQYVAPDEIGYEGAF